jgi:hypothetical protein
MIRARSSSPVSHPAFGARRRRTPPRPATAASLPPDSGRARCCRSPCLVQRRARAPPPPCLPQSLAFIWMCHPSAEPSPKAPTARPLCPPPLFADHRALARRPRVPQWCAAAGVCVRARAAPSRGWRRCLAPQRRHPRQPPLSSLGIAPLCLTASCERPPQSHTRRRPPASPPCSPQTTSRTAPAPTRPRPSPSPATGRSTPPRCVPGLGASSPETGPTLAARRAPYLFPRLASRAPAACPRTPQPP